MQIGDAVKKLRQERKLRQNEFADICNITQSYLSQIENNKKRPNLELLERMSGHLDVPLPVVLFLALTEDDVDASKRALFNVMKPSINKFIDEIFVTA